MKIKIFSESLTTKIEELVNNFLQCDEIGKVIDIKQSESLNDGQWSLTISVVYEERVKSSFDDVPVIAL